MSDLTTVEHKPNPLTMARVMEHVRVWWINWKSRAAGKAYRTLYRAMQDDPDYARSWNANISMPIYDELRRNGFKHTQSIKIANTCGDKLMRHLFSVEPDQDL
jgi:hypothetical protein